MKNTIAMNTKTPRVSATIPRNFGSLFLISLPSEKEVSYSEDNVDGSEHSGEGMGNDKNYRHAEGKGL